MGREVVISGERGGSKLGKRWNKVRKEVEQSEERGGTKWGK